MELLQLLNASYPLRLERIAPLRDVGSTSYLACGRGGKPYLCKCTKAAFGATARQSAEVVRYLYAQGFPTPEILLTNNGVPWLEFEGQALLLFAFIEGWEPRPGEGLEALGALTGRLHTLMERYPSELTAQGKPFFIERYLAQLWQEQYARIDAFEEIGERLWAAAEHLPQGFCHGDLHRGNVVRASGSYYFYDFDTACRAFPAYDMATLCDATDYFTWHSKAAAQTERNFERFLRGYETCRPAEQAERAALWDMIALRHFQLQATIIALYGLACVDDDFLDAQLAWLKQCAQMKQ